MYRIDWTTNEDSALMPRRSGSQKYATEQEARQAKEMLKATIKNVVVMGPYKETYAQRIGS